MRNLKAQVGPGAIVPFIMVLVVAIVLLTVGSYITFSVGNTMSYTCAGTPCTGANVIATPMNTIATNGTSSLSTVSTWFNILGIVFIASVVIGLLMYAFGGRKGGAY